MNKTINLLGKPDKLSTFLLVWQGGNSEYFCEFIHDKDYETAEYAILQILPKTGINNAILYKSAVKPNIDIWVRIEIDDLIFVGYCVANRLKSGEQCLSESEIMNHIKWINKPVIDNWWAYYELLPDDN